MNPSDLLLSELQDEAHRLVDKIASVKGITDSKKRALVEETVRKLQSQLEDVNTEITKRTKHDNPN